jgi:hypothetical protein
VTGHGGGESEGWRAGATTVADLGLCEMWRAAVGAPSRAPGSGQRLTIEVTVW